MFKTKYFCSLPLGLFAMNFFNYYSLLLLRLALFMIYLLFISCVLHLSIDFLITIYKINIMFNLISLYN